MEAGRVGVVGAGQMGCGIAQVAAQAQLEVVLVDASAELAQGGKRKIGDWLSKLVDKGKLGRPEREALLGRIRSGSGLADLAEVDVVIEAASESVDLKRRLFAQLDETCKKGAILASNTSSISITLLGSATQRPDCVIGMHFMNPVPLMKLVEVIPGLATSAHTIEATLALAGRLGKTTVTSRDMPGFIVNRVMMPLLNEACFALQEGLASAKDIDTACKLGLNHPMGPLELADLIGLDTCLAVIEVLHSQLGEDKYRPCPLLRQHVQAGFLGRKTGRGFYTYA